MPIEKKSLISTLKTTKRANVAASTPSHDLAHKMNKGVVKSVVKSPTKSVVKTVVKSPTKSVVKTVVKSPTKSVTKKMHEL